MAPGKPFDLSQIGGFPADGGIDFHPAVGGPEHPAILQAAGACSRSFWTMVFLRSSTDARTSGGVSSTMSRR